MIIAKIKAYNDENSDECSEEEGNATVTKEVLEQQAQTDYNNAIQAFARLQLEKAEELFYNLLKNELLIAVVPNAKARNKPQPLIYRLKYCCYWNLANTLAKSNKHEAAMRYYIKAAELDDTDISLWYRLGKVSLKIPKLHVAIDAFTQALRYNPKHFASLDAIITSLYAIGDKMSSLVFISQCFKQDPTYEKGIAFKEAIFKNEPWMEKAFRVYHPDRNLDVNHACDINTALLFFREVEELQKGDASFQTTLASLDASPLTSTPFSRLQSSTWTALGRFLLKLYRKLYSSQDENDFSRPIRLKSLTNECAISEKMEGSGSDASDSEEEILKRMDSCKRRKSPTLADALKFCDKRRSARNKTVLKNNEQKQSLSKILKNAIPYALLTQVDAERDTLSDPYRWWCDDSMDTMDIYRLFESQEHLSDNLPSVPRNHDLEGGAREKLIRDDGYFGTEKETGDVEIFLELHADETILELLEAFAKELAPKWCYMWPEGLARSFVKIFKAAKYHSHCGIRLKSVLNWEKERGFVGELCGEDMAAELKMVILYGELVLDEFLQGRCSENPLSSGVLGGDFCSLLLGDMEDALSILNALETDPKLWLRCLWLESLLFLHKEDVVTAECYLNAIMEDLPEADMEVRLPNLSKFYAIRRINAKRIRNSIKRNEDLSKVRPLYEMEEYERVAEILMQTLSPEDRDLLLNVSEKGVLCRLEQYNILLASLWKANKMEDMFRWCEVAFYEGFVIFRKTFYDESDTDVRPKWAGLITNAFQGMSIILSEKGDVIFSSLSNECAQRLVQTLISLVCYQIEAVEPIPEIISDVITPWILKSNLLRHQAFKHGFKESDTIPCWIKVLFIAHEHLGRRKWCCFRDGELLFYTLKMIQPYLKSTCDVEMRDQMLQQTDQIFYCLYQHPYKRNRPRLVQDHNTLGIALTWTRAVQAFEFYAPVTKPAFDSKKPLTISADMESLLSRMALYVPEELNAEGMGMQALKCYINGHTNEFPKEFARLPAGVADFYYLLADYYFKNKIMQKAIKYYMLDLCFNPARMDSWAALSLAHQHSLDLLLNSCETMKDDMCVLTKVGMIHRCFKTALDLDHTQSTLWIEYGGMCYCVYAYCSRLMKRETTNLSIQSFQLLDEQKSRLLKKAFDCFTNANKYFQLSHSGLEEDQVLDERWLHHYMQGKILEKQEIEPALYIEHYLEALKYLIERGAEFPARVCYSNPQMYAVEAIEVYYRIGASILKYLESHEGKLVSTGTAEYLTRALEEAKRPFFRPSEGNSHQEEAVAVLVNIIEKATAMFAQGSGRETFHTDGKVVHEKNEGFISLEAKKELALKCVEALEICRQRFPEHFKCAYRMAYHFFRNKMNFNVDRTRELLLNTGGLFGNRKSNNLFNGIWRIPSMEIDRPGSFSYHMYRNVHLLLEFLRTERSYKLLLNLAINLRELPEPGKKYMRDNLREYISREALELCVQVLKGVTGEKETWSLQGGSSTRRHHLLEVWKCYTKAAKYFPNRESYFAKALVHMQKKYARSEKGTLEYALLYCKKLSTFKADEISPELMVEQMSSCSSASVNVNVSAGASASASGAGDVKYGEDEPMNLSVSKGEGSIRKGEDEDMQSKKRRRLEEGLKDMKMGSAVTTIGDITLLRNVSTSSTAKSTKSAVISVSAVDVPTCASSNKLSVSTASINLSTLINNCVATAIKSTYQPTITAATVSCSAPSSWNQSALSMGTCSFSNIPNVSLPPISSIPWAKPSSTTANYSNILSMFGVDRSDVRNLQSSTMRSADQSILGYCPKISADMWNTSNISSTLRNLPPPSNIASKSVTGYQKGKVGRPSKACNAIQSQPTSVLPGCVHPSYSGAPPFWNPLTMADTWKPPHLMTSKTKVYKPRAPKNQHNRLPLPDALTKNPDLSVIAIQPNQQQKEAKYQHKESKRNQKESKHYKEKHQHKGPPSQTYPPASILPVPEPSVALEEGHRPTVITRMDNPAMQRHEARGRPSSEGGLSRSQMSVDYANYTTFLARSGLPPQLVLSQQGINAMTGLSTSTNPSSLGRNDSEGWKNEGHWDPIYGPLPPNYRRK